MTLCPCLYSSSGASARRKRQTLSSIGPHIFGKSAHVVAAATTAVGVASTVFTVTSTLTSRIVSLFAAGGTKSALPADGMRQDGRRTAAHLLWPCRIVPLHLAKGRRGPV